VYQGSSRKKLTHDKEPELQVEAVQVLATPRI
jgi:hypothetical protein